MSKEARIKILEARKQLIMTRNPVENLNISKKIDRKLRKLRNE